MLSRILQNVNMLLKIFKGPRFMSGLFSSIVRGLKRSYTDMLSNDLSSAPEYAMAI